MPRILFPVLLVCLIVAATFATQQQPANPPAAEPQVKVNVLNVCTPSAAEQKEIASALARVPRQPLFGSDFEVSRGRSTLSDMPNFLKPGQSTHVAGEASVANYVRVRREFSVQALFASVQYSFSNDGQNMVETLVLHVRDPKDLMLVSLEDSASSISSPEVMLTANTPVSRIRLERFGKSSVALARCAATESGTPIDQTAYEPLFRSASEVLANYRGLLGARNIVPEELGKVEPGSRPSKSGNAPNPNKPAPNSKMKKPVEVKR